MTTNRVARFRGDGVIEFEDVVMPPLKEGWLRVRVAVCALCGSDKRLLQSGSPVVPGHELAGTVVDSAAVGDPQTGARVLVYIPVFCGECKACLQGQTNRCFQLEQLIGWQVDGGFADLVDIPAQCAFPIPDDISFEVAVLGLDTIGTAAHGLRMGIRTQEGNVSSALVIGCGPLGLGVIAVAQELGIEKVYAFDPNRERLQMALELGAAPATDLDTVNQFQMAVEVSGSASGRELAQRVTEPGGAILALGESNEPYSMPANPRWRRTDCFTVRSFYFPHAELDANWELLRRHGARLQNAIMSATTLDELPQTFERFTSGEYIKPYVTHENRATTTRPHENQEPVS
ncbi:alcohol dehydrogenase catalytic domain-containing protein [Glaciibacter superstes]|uniref:alcohol dehydrogenase catalytic domain-containing protein n=1 Tax=Glaciibacter superstes TaxID=501023 RepID=UPI0003B46196|nr:alcohol dehydrogenase catalytic domain-containing protein [Glaciibacter superstes]